MSRRPLGLQGTGVPPNGNHGASSRSTSRSTVGRVSGGGKPPTGARHSVGNGAGLLSTLDNYSNHNSITNSRHSSVSSRGGINPVRSRSGSLINPKVPSSAVASPHLGSIAVKDPFVRKGTTSARSAIPGSSNLGVRDYSAANNLATERQRIAMAAQDQFAADNEFPRTFASGYECKALLGRGGCAAVWLGVHKESGEEFAVKHVNKIQAKNRPNGDHEVSALWREVCAAQAIALRAPPVDGEEEGGVVRLVEVQDTQRDTFLVYERGGQSLTKLLFEVKGEFSGGQRIYRIHHQTLLLSAVQNPSLWLRWLLKGILEGLDKLHQARVVHSDLKPDNVLVIPPSRTAPSGEVRLIDFGSAFLSYYVGSGGKGNVPHTSSLSPDLPADLEDCLSLDLAHQNGAEVFRASGVNTPEYMPPELVCPEAAASGAGTSLLKKQEGVNTVNLDCVETAGGRKVSATDVWSVGALMLEIALGVPLWLSYPARVKRAVDGKDVLVQGGMFAVPGKAGPKIVQKQLDTICRLDEILDRQSHGVRLGPRGRDLLKWMLAWRPLERPTPLECLDHPFFSEEDV